MKHSVAICCLLFSLFLASATAFENELQSTEKDLRSDNPLHKCFEILGCFLKKLFTDPNREEPFLPQSIEEVDTNFLVYTRENKPRSGSKNIIKYDDESTATSSGFKRDLPVTFLVHGFKASGESDWVLDLANNILAVKDVNVIVVDWNKGASGGSYWTPYDQYKQGVANTWVVGKQAAKVCEFLQKHLGVKYEDVHFIGHSLGSHISGYAGADLNGEIGRISALDPAEPEFQNTAKHIRLDSSDAKFVDATHTDATAYSTVSGFGMKQPVGHVDFYPNGGEDQPGCKLKRDENFEEQQLAHSKRLFDSLIACRHGRAYQYYNYSFNPSSCAFVGHECEDYESYIQGKCNSCGEDGTKCLKMGYYANEATKTTPVNRKFYFMTSDSAPFCVHQYSIELVLNKQPVKYGLIDLILYGSKKTHTFQMEVKEGDSIKQVIGAPNDLGEVKKVELLCKPYSFIWHNSRKLCKDDEFDVKEIRVEPMNIQKETDRTAASTVLCPVTPGVIKADTMVEFKAKSCTPN